MLLKKEFKYCIKPTIGQSQLFAQFAGACRFLYNRRLQQRKTAYEQNGLVPLKGQEVTHWLQDIHSQQLPDKYLNNKSSFSRSRECLLFPKFKSVIFFFCLIVPIFSHAYTERLYSESYVEIDDEDDEDDECRCGTIDDPNYSRAVETLDDAISQLGFIGHEFPYSYEDITEDGGYPFFTCEGVLHWDIGENEYDYPYLCCTRLLERADRVDIRNTGEQIKFTEQEKRIFPIRKDYSSFLSIFPCLQNDAAFLCQYNIDFLTRRKPEVKAFWKSPASYTSALWYEDAILKIKDLRKMIEESKKKYQKCSKGIEKEQKKATFYCKKSLDYCIANHNNPVAHVDRGLIDYLDGDVLQAYDRLAIALKKIQQEDLESIKEKALLLKGRSELEAGLYADAILTLTDLLDKYPSNHEAYLDRAEAYFELGDFDVSLKDYLASEIKHDPISSDAKDMLDFSLGLTKGILQSGAQAGIEFIPSILSSLQGLSQGLWAFSQNPVHISKQFVQAAQNCVDFVKEHTPKKCLAHLCPSLKSLCKIGINYKMTGKGSSLAKSLENMVWIFLLEWAFRKPCKPIAILKAPIIC